MTVAGKEVFYFTVYVMAHRGRVMPGVTPQDAHAFFRIVIADYAIAAEFTGDNTDVFQCGDVAVPQLYAPYFMHLFVIVNISEYTEAAAVLLCDMLRPADQAVAKHRVAPAGAHVRGLLL